MKTIHPSEVKLNQRVSWKAHQLNSEQHDCHSQHHNGDQADGHNLRHLSFPPPEAVDNERRQKSQT